MGVRTITKIRLSIFLIVFMTSEVSISARADDAADRCRALARTDSLPLRDAQHTTSLSSIVGAATQVTEATFAEARDTSPSYCEVSGFVAPSVGFVMRLPVAHWNGRFLQLG